MTDSAHAVDGLFNFRDTGGLALTAGGSSSSGVLFRSDALFAVSPAGLTALAATDIGVIVDFRTPAERASAPDRIPTSRPFHTVELSILQGAMADLASQFLRPGASAPTPAELAQAAAAVPTLGDMYVSMLQASAQPFAEVARLVAHSSDREPTAVLVHCTAGKDRTGVATAIMLDAAGVTRTAVVDDYASSQEHLAGPWADQMLQMIASFGMPVTPHLRTLATGTPPEAIQQALEWVDTTFGDSASYLLSGGLTGEELADLRSRIAG